MRRVENGEYKATSCNQAFSNAPNNISGKTRISSS